MPLCVLCEVFLREEEEEEAAAGGAPSRRRGVKSLEAVVFLAFQLFVVVIGATYTAQCAPLTGLPICAEVGARC